MDYSKIRLNNERNEHVTKRLNRLSAWKFFRVLNRDNVWRLIGFSFLMVLCLVPLFAMIVLGSINLSGLEQTLPTLNSFGFSTGVWSGVADYYNHQAMLSRIQTAFFALSASLLATIILSGGFAVIRDAFWTGKLSTVGVFRSMWKGIKANIVYAFISTLLIAASVFGIYVFCLWAQLTLPVWATVICAIALSIVAMFLGVYLLILCSVSVTYKQSVFENLDDSWRLMWLNILPNIVHFLVALLPIPLYFVFQGSLLQMIYLTLILMFGGMYFPFVWQTHMMKTFALFHPVEAKKKNK
ncbi:MAG: hypothetical protein J1F66_00025 [Clostridiales bacterium]|nr:hypothetical protein [Clostridiales bacterium]